MPKPIPMPMIRHTVYNTICIYLVAFLASATGAGNREVMIPSVWFDYEMKRITTRRGNLFFNYSFNNDDSQLYDLCEADMTPSLCWEARGKHQNSIIYDHRTLGRQLYLDCMPQSSSADEFVYHESLVHPAMIAHHNPRRVLIVGGGEGGTAREVLRHGTVESLVMVDLDRTLVKLSQQHLPYWAGVSEDPRFKLVEGDGMAWMKEYRERLGAEERFDVVIWDLPDAVKETAWLYNQRHMELAKLIMHPDAVFASHSGGDVCTKEQWEDAVSSPYVHTCLAETITKRVFAGVSRRPLLLHSVASCDTKKRMAPQLHLGGPAPVLERVSCIPGSERSNGASSAHLKRCQRETKTEASPRGRGAPSKPQGCFAIL